MRSWRSRRFQSTRPVWGATGERGDQIASDTYFNPRAPCGARHAPQSACYGGAGNFNPRAPCGARLIYSNARCSAYWFQSTRPVWGATLFAATQAITFFSFNPRAPCGARLRGYIFRDFRRWVSIHAPRVGRDLRHDLVGFPAKGVSIHAPRVGRDAGEGRALDGAASFNPRAPCGARPGYLQALSQLPEFQSTRPVWGATNNRVQGFLQVRVSSHAPRVGRDRRRPALWSISASFNPRAPCGARLHHLRLQRPARGVSIHAPRVGRDPVSPFAPSLPGVSIHAPRVGRDEEEDVMRYNSIVSIHAPRVGRDRWHFRYNPHRQCFNPRAPCGARPCPPTWCVCFMSCFNPRAPCGARRGVRMIYTPSVWFQSTRPVWGATTPGKVHSHSTAFQSTRPVWGATAIPDNAVYCLQFQSTRPVWGATANLTILPRQICTKGTKEFLFGRKTHGKKEK